VRRRDFLFGATAAMQAAPAPFMFVDVAKQAGLTQPVIYGGIDTKKYILETNGCGIAFTKTIAMVHSPT
jgi:hypothetical protein